MTPKKKPILRPVIKYYVSSRTATGQVDTDDKRIITHAPPIWRVFVGQPISNLLRWLEKTNKGDVHQEVI
jgi:hypothetical protein